MQKLNLQKKHTLSRMGVLLTVFGILFSILIGRLFQLQIINGKEYAENFELKIKREVALPGTRGNIYDRNGKPLAVNKLAYSVTFQETEVYDSERERQLDLNGKIYRMNCIIKEHGDSIENNLEIAADGYGGYEFTVSGFSLERFKADVYGRARIEEMEKEEKNAAAEDIIEFLSDKFCVRSQDGKEYTEEERKAYGLPGRLGEQELLELLSVRYALSLQEYRKYLPVTVANGVSEETAAAVVENQPELAGAGIKEDSVRVYGAGEAASCVLGYIGLISAEELESKKEEGYKSDSVIGKSGMEKYLEDTLRGTEGRKEVYVDNRGNVIEDLGVTKEPKAGKDVYLSIDMELQQKTYDALEKEIADILLSHLINAKTFDREGISDTTQIRIPAYDVYAALLENGAVDLAHLQEEGASETEKEIYEKFTVKKERAMDKIGSQLKDNLETYSESGQEMQAYQSLIIEELEQSGVTDKEGQDRETLEKWENGELSLNGYLHALIRQGNIKSGSIAAQEQYLQEEEMYEALSAYIMETMQTSAAFEKLVYKYMILDGGIAPEEIFMVLYDQGFLDKEDGDFESWQSGEISVYELMVTKIQDLDITPADLALEPCSGSAVVTDTKTGKVLACVSYPGYDNNRLADRSDSGYYRKISNNASLPLYNRATQQLSAPGSTFKPVTVIAGLEEGVTDSATTVVCDGVFDKVEPPLRCWNHAGHGTVGSASSALKNSCNDYLCEVAYRLGVKENEAFSDDRALEYIQKYAKMFDLDKKSGIELPESSPQITDRYAIPSAIGQGTNNFSTVQLGRYVTTLANRGTSFRLSLIGRIDGIEKRARAESEIELSDSTWESVHTGMEQYAESTGIFEGCPVPAAGKSGTAQETKTKPDHGLFVGYAPAQEPEIAVAVRIINGYDAEGAVVCAREIFEAYFGE